MAPKVRRFSAIARIMGLGSCLMCSELAANSTDNNFTPNIPTVPGATSGTTPGGPPSPFGMPPGEQFGGAPGAPGAPGANTGGAGFSQFLQQQTANAMPTFKNVTYQHLSASEKQNDFGSTSSDDSTPPTTFNVFEANS